MQMKVKQNKKRRKENKIEIEIKESVEGREGRKAGLGIRQEN